MRRKYNKELVDWLRNNAIKYTIKELTAIVNKRYNENYTDKSIRKLLYSNRIDFKYECRQRAFNNAYSRPIGSELVKPDGMTLVKVSKNEWKYKQRLIYEEYYNVKLNEDEYVIFLDQDRTNFNINNLKVITRRESSILSNQHIFSKIPEATETGIQVAKLMIKMKELKKEGE